MIKTKEKNYSNFGIFEVPPIASALDFRLWLRAVNIKNEGTLDYASKHWFIQLNMDSVKVKFLSIHPEYVLYKDVKTVT